MYPVSLIGIAACVSLWILLRLRKSKTPPPPPPVIPVKISKPKKPKRLKPLHERKIILSGHSIDRASTRHHGVYLAYREHSEDGLHSWLMREMKSLQLSGQLADGENNINHLGVLWAIVVRADIVVLKSLSFKKGKQRRKKPLSKNQIAKLKRRKGNAQLRDD